MSPSFGSAKKAFLWMNAVGGVAVLLTYAWGLAPETGVGSALWGGVPESLRPLYTVNMFLAAGGYFLFTPYILFRLDADVRIGGRGFGLFTFLYALVLFPSAAWLPLTAAILEAPSPWLWWVVRIDLLLVGIGAVGLLVALLGLSAAPRGRVWAVIGLAPFILQTAVLDALVWPAYFDLPAP